MAAPELIFVTNVEYPDGALGRDVYNERRDDATPYVLKSVYDELFRKAIMQQREIAKLVGQNHLLRGKHEG